jgi:hypothetical protein
MERLFMELARLERQSKEKELLRLAGVMQFNCSSSDQMTQLTHQLRQDANGD